MTDQEKLILNKSAELWNEFIKLPVQHPDDIPEMRSKLHDIQRMIMCREAVRNANGFLYNESDGNKAHT